MFKRRIPLTLPQKFIAWVWPPMGWKRSLNYGQLRLIRIKGSTQSIAVGFAFGASVSFTPLPGLHIISAGFLSLLTKGNLIASLAGTLVGNPWTFPIMWWLSYKAGEMAFHLFGAHIQDMPENITLDYLISELTHDPMTLMVPWATGGLILMALSWPFFYIFSYRAVSGLRKKHNRHHHERTGRK